jgi:hypothetical protein
LTLTLLKSPKTTTLFWLSALALAFNTWATSLLNANYAASKFPVPYYEAQLSFSAEKIKAWYAFLINHGTLEQYVHTQHIDILFILSTLLLHVLVLTLVSRLFSEHSKARKTLVICALISSLAQMAEQLKNLVSYVMLANPSDFPAALAYMYSSFPVLKFTVFVFAYVAVVIGTLLAGYQWLKRSHQKAVAAY